ncbi:hypothetical protein D9613_005625 [Agrocybe pediades]|uniref:Uncharacterized protein n=1 Tax=Agrocybe pediades TaxID=84607 RepID=A0A8H4QUK9_9AGAR|nr:hypothetical protein D9613_005625 [Agrocybe pediades]KAF9561070.1 hypothetical protein CPC08DRAFT_707646 [Agrocybe pediades]
MPSTRNSSALTRKLPHSSDTELFVTPPRKRYRNLEDEDSPTCSSVSSRSSPRKRQRNDTPPKREKEFDLERLLRDIVAKPTDTSAILSLKTIPKDERALRLFVKGLVYSAKCAVMKRFGKSKKGKMLETELYLEWLKELDYVSSAVDIAMNAKVPGTRKRVPGLGRASFMLLFNLVDEFIDEVNAHHDSPSRPSHPFCYPETMTLVEEAKDPSTDARSEEAVRDAEEYLSGIDSVLAVTVKRYKVEGGWNNASLASKISTLEHALAKGCCLLCEQTGYGTNENDMGDTLMEDTRRVMREWKAEYDDCEDQLDSD